MRILRSRSRSHDGGGWLDSRHSFSFGRRRGPMNTHFGRLLVNNDDHIAAGSGFDTHSHRDMEIVTCVLSGSLVHQDSEGNSGIIYPGLAQRRSAGSGILHSERNDGWRDGSIRHDQAPGHPVHLVQMWVVPDSTGGDPGYEQAEIAPGELENQLVVVAGVLPPIPPRYSPRAWRPAGRCSCRTRRSSTSTSRWGRWSWRAEADWTVGGMHSGMTMLDVRGH